MCVIRSSQNKCRLCLSDSEHSLSIFDPQYCEGIPLAMKIMVCLSLAVAPNDSLPKLICARCTDLISRFYEFREECINSHMKLMQYYADNDSEMVSSMSEVQDPGGEDDQKEKSKQDLMYTEALQESGEKEVVEESYVQEVTLDDGSLETVTVICGKFEEVVETDKVPGVKVTEEMPDVEVEDLVLHMSNSEDSSDVDVVKTEQKASTGADASCFMQLERVSDTVYILKSVDVKSEGGDGELEPERHKCPGCIKVFPTEKMLQEHWAVCQQNDVEVKMEPPKHKRSPWGTGRKYPCPTCGKVFRVPAMLRNHERVHTGERPFLCSLCSRSFTQLYALRNHEQQHRGESPYPCSHCGKGFFRPSDLEKHVRCHTDERPYMCSVCSKAFHQLSGLVVHERIHTGERPYTCSFCPMTFNQWANKQRHEKTHAGGKKPFTCDLCHRKFPDKKEMELHRAGHGGGRPRVCQYCTKSFRKPSELRDHMRRIHTNERPYKCELCTKAFFVAHELKQHLMVHTGERPFECQYCQRSFTQKGNLKRHLEIHHKNEDVVQEETNLIVEEVDMHDMQLAEFDSGGLCC